MKKKLKKDKKPSFENIQHTEVVKESKSLNSISTEGGFYFLSRLNKLFLKFVIDEFLYCIADSPLHIALH